MPREDWKDIPEFPLYAVSDQGRIMNVMYDRIKVLSRNRAGILHVIMMRDDQTTARRSVAHLVAEAFLDPPQRDDFTTIIHLDGDRMNCGADNLMWRPRWFAIRYHKQFSTDSRRGFREPIEDVATGETFDNSWQAALKYGLIDYDIMISTLNRTYCFPTGQVFRTLDN